MDPRPRPLDPRLLLTPEPSGLPSRQSVDHSSQRTKALLGVAAVYFLRKKVGGKAPVKVKDDPADGDDYRLETFATLAVQGEDELVNPLYFGGTPDDDPFATQLAAVPSLDDLASTVQSAARP